MGFHLNKTANTPKYARRNLWSGASKPSTTRSCLKMIIQMVQVALQQSAAVLPNFQSHPLIGQMFSHSWISAALSYWNLFKLNFIISRMGFLQSFQLSPSPSFARAQVRARRIPRNFTAKNIYYLYWNEKKFRSINQKPIKLLAYLRKNKKLSCQSSAREGRRGVVGKIEYFIT